jgi:predicted  nucleic acid-binding Zn-ribbon protein
MTEVTYEAVAAAAANLEQEGGRATADAVREALGAGSVAAIHRHLSAWRAASATPAEPPKAELPESLLAALGDWARQYAQQAGSGARDALSQSEGDTAALLASVERLEAERDDLRDTIDSLTAELRNARHIASEALVGKAKDQLAIDGKDRQIADLRNQIERNVAEAATQSDALLAVQMELVGATTARDNFEAEIRDLRAQLDARRTRG